MYKKFDLESRKQDPQIPSLVHLKWVQAALDKTRPWTSTSWDSMRGRQSNGSRSQRSSEREDLGSLKDSIIVSSLHAPSGSPGSIKLDSSPRMTSEKPCPGPSSPYVQRSNYEQGALRPQSQKMFGSLKNESEATPIASASPRQPQCSSNSRSRPASARAISMSRKNMSEMLDQIIEPLLRPGTAHAVSACHRRLQNERIVSRGTVQSPPSHFQPISAQLCPSSIHPSNHESQVQSTLLQASPPLLRRAERPSTAPARPSTGLKRPITAPMSQTCATSLSTVAIGPLKANDGPDRVKAPTTMAERQEKLKKEKDVEGRLVRALLSDLSSLRQKLVIVQSQLDDSYQNIVMSQSNQDALQTQLDRTKFSWAIAEKELKQLQSSFGRLHSVHNDTSPDDFATENEGGYTSGASTMLIAALKLENFLDEAGKP
jgi:hypothetical protein